jgi:hypothetical protein
LTYRLHLNTGIVKETVTSIKNRKESVRCGIPEDLIKHGDKNHLNHYETYFRNAYIWRKHAGSLEKCAHFNNTKKGER